VEMRSMTPIGEKYMPVSLDKKIAKLNLDKKSPIILSGIGQNILMKSFNGLNVILFESFIKSKTSALRKSATYHAPAVSIACLLDEIIE